MRTLSLAFTLFVAIGCGSSDSSSTPAGTTDTAVTVADPGAAPVEDTAAPPVEDTAAPPAGPTYDGEVQAIFKKYCGPCHDSGKSGGHSVASSYADSQKDAGACAGKKVGECSLERIKKGEMPLGGGCDSDPTQATCPQAADIETLQKWVDAKMPEK